MSATEVVWDMPEAEYHALPRFSSTAAKRLLPPNTPAHFKRWREERAELTERNVRIGSAVHAKVLGTHRKVVHIDADDWRTKAARELRDATLAAGNIPLLDSENAQARAARDALLSHPLVSRLIDRDAGHPEVTILWTDPETGIDCKARLDWLPRKVAGRRLVGVDLKTTTERADPYEFARQSASLNYPVQGGLYMEAIEAAGLGADGVTFVWIVAEQQAPYCVSVVQIDDHQMRVGRELAASARRIYAACTESGEWPGYPPGVHQVSLPAWWDYAAQDILDREEYTA